MTGRGRRPYPLRAIVRVHLMQNWFALSDPTMEKALYEIASLRTFAGLGLESIPNETTILNFRHLLETTTAANEADVEQVTDLLHDKKDAVWADSGYRGAQSRLKREGQWLIAGPPAI